VRPFQGCLQWGRIYCARRSFSEGGSDQRGNLVFTARLSKHRQTDISFSLRTDDLDLAISLLYLGKEVRIPEFLKETGFREGFNPDSSIYFYRSGLRVDFLVPEKGRGVEASVKIGKLVLSAQALRFLNILLDEPAEIKISKKLKIRIPSLSVE